VVIALSDVFIFILFLFTLRRGNRVDFVGSGSVADAEVLPVRIESLAGVVIRQIACGAYHTAVLAGTTTSASLIS
jgi:hypothetical protein